MNKKTRRQFFHFSSKTLLAGAPFYALLQAWGQTNSETGIAVYYSDIFHGRPVASGATEKYDKNALTAAHNRHPFGTRVRVTNLTNDKSVVVTINDRMRSRSKLAIDLSRRAAEELGFVREGKTRVRIEAVQD
jgi:rare lipoprotein A